MTKKRRLRAWAALLWGVVGTIAILYLAFQPDSAIPPETARAKTDLPDWPSEEAALSSPRAARLSKLYFLTDFEDSETPVIWLEHFESGEKVEVREQQNSEGMRLLGLKVAVNSRLAVAYVEYQGEVEEFRNNYVEDVLVQSTTLMPGEPEPAIPEGLTEPVMAEGLTDPVIPEGLSEPFAEDNLPDPSMLDQSAGE